MISREAEFGPMTCPFIENSEGDYERACDACEIWHVIDSPERLLEIVALLVFDKRSAGNHGKCLLQNYHGLREGDRLEPSDSLQDIAELENITDFPTKVLF